jgi:hypothetical protein
VNKQQFRRLATVGAAAALSLQLLAGVASAAVPSAQVGGSAYGSFTSGGYAGFSASYTLTDSGTLSKLYMEADITGGASVPVLLVTRDGASAKGCEVQATPLAVKCTFKTVRSGEVVNIRFGVNPLATASAVSTEPLWSGSGFVTGGNQSHGDSWSSGVLTSSRSTNPDLAAGFGNLTLTTKADFSSNNQYAKLQNLPSGVYASVDDNTGGIVDGFAAILLSVNDGGPATFQLLVTYPNGVGAPDYFTHVSAGYPTATYYACAKNATKVNCFDWSNKANTITLYLTHNGSIRRSG